MNNKIYEAVRNELDRYNQLYSKATGSYGPIRNTDILAQNITIAIEKGDSDDRRN